jgi:hypothetical protein
MTLPLLLVAQPGRKTASHFSWLRFCARENKKGRWRTISLAVMGRQFVAAYVFSRLFRRLLRGRRREHRYERAALKSLVERHVTVGNRENGVILANTNALAGMELGAALTDDDVAGLDGLAAEHLHAKTLTG